MEEERGPLRLLPEGGRDRPAEDGKPEDGEILHRPGELEEAVHRPRGNAEPLCREVHLPVPADALQPLVDEEESQHFPDREVEGPPALGQPEGGGVEPDGEVLEKVVRRALGREPS